MTLFNLEGTGTGMYSADWGGGVGAISFGGFSLLRDYMV